SGCDGVAAMEVMMLMVLTWWQRLRWLCMVLKWVGGDEGGGMMMVAVDLWWGRGLGWRGVDASRMMAAMVMNKVV
ncbi:hypothetical protein Tco_1323458, partial [Tanacetum coccineum]